MNNIKIVVKPGVYNTQVLQSDGKEIACRAADVHLEAGKEPVVTLEVIAFDADVEAKASFKMLHPLKKEFKTIKRVEFIDGEILDLE